MTRELKMIAVVLGVWLLLAIIEACAITWYEDSKRSRRVSILPQQDKKLKCRTM
jgi:hypothetical protein